jgi:RHS repeat-associated protein
VAYANNERLGYTGHAQLDAFGLIHMNGRLYDPVIARFISADPYVQDGGDTQGTNRYSYIGNNPLNTVDPSGFIAMKVVTKAETLEPVEITGRRIYDGPKGGSGSPNSPNAATLADRFNKFFSSAKLQNLIGGFKRAAPAAARIAGKGAARSAIASAAVNAVPGAGQIAAIVVIVGGASYSIYVDGPLILGVFNSAVGADSTKDNGGKAEGANTPALPTDVVGDQSDPRAGPNDKGGKWASGRLKPEKGGTGDFEKDLNHLTRGTRPWQPGDKAPPGSLVGPNGIFGRDPNSSGGKSIDIPSNGTKPHETLHYP